MCKVFEHHALSDSPTGVKNAYREARTPLVYSGTRFAHGNSSETVLGMYLVAVAECRIKTVAILVAAVMGFVVVLCPFQPANAASGLQNTPSEPNLLTGKDPNLITPQNGNYGGMELFLKMMLSVLLVVVLGIAAVYVSRRLLPKLKNLPGRRIKVVETVHLGPRKAVHLLEIDNQCILVGSTNDRIIKLADITTSKMDFSTAYAERIEDGNDH